MFRHIKRLGAFAVAASIGLIVWSTALPAHAHHTASPPFELVFPQEVDKTSFHNDWGSRRSGGRRHRGTDLMAKEKMVEVYAVADGVIEKINESRRPGRYVIIQHDAGWSSIYIHLNDDNIGTDDGDAPWYLTLAPAVEVGAKVEAGQLIGWAGDSGNAEGSTPHTHFELHYNGRAVNPFHHLAPAYERDMAALERSRQLVANQIFGPIQIV
ncbi:MAG: M23 family metallopeptidase [Deltaproteobacteria bacterium]|nr:M23 family metallopeptidase [Deltaproteobacteria bacterium]